MFHGGVVVSRPIRPPLRRGTSSYCGSVDNWSSIGLVLGWFRIGVGLNWGWFKFAYQVGLGVDVRFRPAYGIGFWSGDGLGLVFGLGVQG